MLKNIFDLSFVRNRNQAVGFYFAYVIVTLAIAVIIGGFVGIFFPQTVNEIALTYGKSIDIIIVLVVSFGIVYKKNFKGDFKVIAIALTAGMLAVFVGALLGLIPVAYLSTLKPLKK